MHQSTFSSPADLSYLTAIFPLSNPGTRSTRKKSIIYRHHLKDSGSETGTQDEVSKNEDGFNFRIRDDRITMVTSNGFRVSPLLLFQKCYKISPSLEDRNCTSRPFVCSFVFSPLLLHLFLFFFFGFVPSDKTTSFKSPIPPEFPTHKSHLYSLFTQSRERFFFHIFNSEKWVFFFDSVAQMRE